MSNRRSQVTSKHEQRVALSSRIELRGINPDMPCSFCHRKKLRCRMSDDSGRCSECVRRGRPSCDGILVASTRSCRSSPSLCPSLLTYSQLPVSSRLSESWRLRRKKQRRPSKRLSLALPEFVRSNAARGSVRTTSSSGVCRTWTRRTARPPPIPSWSVSRPWVTSNPLVGST